MSAQEDRYALSQTIRSLKQDPDGIDFKTVSADDSDAWLDSIADVYIQIKQFISRRGTPDWNGWGPPIWNDIERGEAALNRRLEKERRKKLRKQRVFSQMEHPCDSSVYGYISRRGILLGLLCVPVQ